jgi:hypothetical protein
MFENNPFGIEPFGTNGEGPHELVGQSIAVQQGNVEAILNKTADLTGQSSTVQQGILRTFGQQISAAAGTVTPVITNGITLIGSAITVEQGITSVAGGARGQAITLFQGTIVASVGSGETLTGSASTTVSGILLPVNNPTTSAGQVISGASGNVVVGGNPVTVNISGVEADFFIGSLIAGTQFVTGQVSTTAAGTLTYVLTLPVVGIGASLAQGNIAASQEAEDTYIASLYGIQIANIDVELVGSDVLMDTEQGNVGTSGDDFKALTGSATVSAAGTLIAVPQLSITGQEISDQQGVFGAPGFASLTGAESAVVAGNVFLTNDRTFPITGQKMVISDGNAVTSYLAFAIGQVLNVSQEGIGPRIVNLFGEQILSRQGVVMPPAVTEALVSTGGFYRRNRTQRVPLYARMPTDEEVLAEREALGILPKKTQKLIVNEVKKIANVDTRSEAALLANAYLQDGPQRNLMDRLRNTAEDQNVRWRDEMFTITHALILDSLRRKADRELLEKLVAEEEAETAEVNEILELWMEL